MKRTWIVATLTAALALGSLGAAEGKIPIWMPTIITQPGHYVLTRDVTATSGPAISIQADGVTLDLNGHTINQPSTTEQAIQVMGMTGGSKGIVIVGGRVEGGYNGVYFQPPDPQMPLVLDDLVISGSAGAAVKGVGFGQLEALGIIIVDSLVGFELLGGAAGVPPPRVPPRAMIRSADIRAGGGIHCAGVACSIRDTVFEYQPPDPAMLSAAISFSGVDSGEAHGIIIIDNTPGGSVTPGLVDITASQGIIIVDSKIHGPGAATGGGACISVDSMSSGVAIRDTEITQCAGDGIHSLGHDVSAAGIVIVGGNQGIFAGGSNFIIDDGKISGNERAGIWFETAGHVYRGNVLRGNQGGALAGPGLTSAVNGGGNIL